MRTQVSVPKHYRIFEFGHYIEDYAAKWLRDAGFDLRTEDKMGQQFGFSIADDEIKGHIDGVICDGPVDMGYPCVVGKQVSKRSTNGKHFSVWAWQRQTRLCNADRFVSSLHGAYRMPCIVYSGK